MDMVRCHCWFSGDSNARGGIPVVTYVLMLALAVSGQQLADYTKELVTVHTYSCGVGGHLQEWKEGKYRDYEWKELIWFDSPSSGYYWVSAEHPPRCVQGRHLPVGTFNQEEITPNDLGSYKDGTVIYSGDNQPVNVGYRIDFSGWDGDDASLLADWIEQQHQEWLHTNPKHQSVWLIDGTRAYLTCPDDNLNDCTLSVSKQTVSTSSGECQYCLQPDPWNQPKPKKPKPSGHAVSTHTKAGK
jgi:hypothetical protein